MSILNKLTEGIVNRDLQKEGDALRAKWERTGLLEGLGSENAKDGMSRLLENQAKELLRESSAMAAGDVEGFAAVAFPIVRRVFGNLIANDLVSVQPMSLPSGLIFFLDFVHDTLRLGAARDDSLYGGGVVGQQITGGVDLTGRNAEKSFYALNNGYSSPTGSSTLTVNRLAWGTFGSGSVYSVAGPGGSSISGEEFQKLCRFDPDLVSGTSTVAIASLAVSGTSQLNKDNLVGIVHRGLKASAVAIQLRRLTQWSGSSGIGQWKAGDPKDTVLLFAANIAGTTKPPALLSELEGNGTINWPQTDDFINVTRSQALGAVVGDDVWGLEKQAAIPEINIKVDSVSVTAVTKKLKAKWTPELGQDLNAYHNLDAEVELTSILSEQIALEIDREILEDLVKGASAGTYYWSRSPGMFLRRDTGAEVGATSAAPDFTGTVSEWYETLVETINDVSAQIHRKTLRGGANVLVVSPEVANILEFTSGFRANITGDEAKGVVGAVKTGSLSKKWDVFVDPYFPRNVVLVARRGSSFLESGYVYAPYVPLQVTPTIFGIEDFVPRKGVLTRYAKKMVRPDMYGLVIVRGLLGEAGA
jgi:hypothetical protein